MNEPRVVTFLHHPTVVLHAKFVPVDRTPSRVCWLLVLSTLALAVTL